jgi:hypothetical protein
MEGYQFGRLEVFSVKGAPGAKGNVPGKRKNGARAWTAVEVLDEAERTKFASLHVISDRPKPQIIPGESKDFASLREAHAKASELRQVFTYTKKDGTKQKRNRKLRADAATLYSSVYSLPVLSADALEDVQLREECETLLKKALEFERRRIAERGGSVELGVIHWDEEFVHIHILALDRQRGRVDYLHPGRAAKAEFHDANRGEGDRAGAQRGGNRAYCDAMRAWQDELYQSVSRDAGLLRYGPKRFRLSRADYKTAKKLASLRAEDERLDEIRNQKDADSTEKARDADHLLKAAKKDKASAAAKLAAIDEGVEAVNDRILDYRPADEGQAEGLNYGPKAPKGKAERKELANRLTPAFDFLVGYAKKIFQLRQKHEALKAAKAKHAEKENLFAKTAQNMHDRLKREQDKQIAIGRLISKAFGQLSRTAPAPILAMLEPSKDVPIDERDFPDAWALPVDADPDGPKKALEEMPNLKLWRVSQENYHAELLSEDDPGLQSRFCAASRLVAEEAAERGLDLKDGRHLPGKATNPEKANRHTDTNPEPIREKKKAKARVRTRG